MGRDRYVIVDGFGPFSVIKALIVGFMAGLFGAAAGGLFEGVYLAIGGAFSGRPPSWWRGRGAETFTSRRRVSLRRVVYYSICLTLSTLWLLSVWSRQAVDAPNEAEVEKMVATVKYYPSEITGNQEGDFTPVTFTVPPEHVPKILAELQPARRDFVPSEWQVLGSVTVVTRDGKTTVIELYITYHKVGAFSVQPGDRERNSGLVSPYFRGGTDSGIEQVLRDAYEASRQ